MFNWHDIDWKRVVIISGKIFGILLIVYLILDRIIMPIYTRHGQSILVPDLTNLVYEDARTHLEKMDLQIVEETKKFDTSNQFPIGVVMGQNPRAGTTVKKGRRIYVIVSKGEPVIEMPNLVHRSERNAIFMIKNLGLEVGNVTYGHSDIFPEGVVVDQNIPQSAEVKLGASVDIAVSLGRFPDQFIVPSLIGRSLTDAKKIIAQAGLSVGEITYQETSDLLPETVIEQSLKADEEVNRGDAIDLVVSKIPDK